MKRSPGLQPLSRDHHKALYAALRLRRADANSARDAVEHFLAFWGEHGERHFEIEEGVLLPGFAAGGGDPRHELVARALADHVEIRSRVRCLGADSPLADLHALGEKLNAHVRLEEAELFPLIERTLDGPALSRLGDELDAAEQSGPT